MKLYNAEFRGIGGLLVAENEQDAIKKAEEKYNLRALPVEVQEIVEVDGYAIMVENPAIEDKPKRRRG